MTHRYQLTFLVRQCFLLFLLVASFSITGCIRSSEHEVVIYSALDREFSEPILDEFSNQTGIKVLPKFDVESSKTVGLVSEIMQSGDRPRCDVFWNNEIMHSIRLKKAGLLDVYFSPSAKSYPSNYIDSEHQWHAFAARARVIIVNTQLIPDARNYPNSIHDFVASKWTQKCAIAKPLFGTSATHAAILFDQWGTEKASEFYQSLQRNASVESGNKQVAQKVANGEFAFGLTDTDDAIIEVDAGKPVTIVYPDQGDDQMGTLFIPNSLCIIKNSSNSEHAKKLVDYLLKPSVEQALANGRSAQFPVNPDVKTRSRAASDSEIRWASVNFESAADQWENASKTLQEIFK